MSELPTPISDQDKLLSNIAIGTPDIEDLIPNSRQEVYLKYIALNGIHELPVSISQGGTGATTSEEARQNLGINLPLPINNGGTGGANAEEARRNLDVMHKVSLYDNSAGTNGTITLSQSVDNFTYLEIFFKQLHTGLYDSLRIYSPNGKLAMMSMIRPYDSNIYYYCASVAISGNSITWDSWATYGTSYDSVTSDNFISIYKVVGISY